MKPISVFHRNEYGAFEYLTLEGRKTKQYKDGKSRYRASKNGMRKVVRGEDCFTLRPFKDRKDKV